MTRTSRPRRLAWTLLAGAIALGLSACGPSHPNSVFTNNTEFNRDIFDLHKTLFVLAAIVFVFVEALLLYVIVKFRRRPGQGEPKHVHGNTTLEVLWTAIPAIILLFIAVPTVRTIFRTQAKARPGALQVEVIGHQWWWEFRYPDYTTRSASGKLDTLTTANELYLPLGRTVNFALKTADVIHSFWIPQLGGKRDVVANHTNYLWFTPDSTQIPGAQAWYGHCTEYCGASHANMRIRAFTVTPEQFESWAQGQLRPAAVGATAPASPAAEAAAPGAGGAAAAAAATQSQAGARPGPQQPAGRPVLSPDVAARSQSAPTEGAGGTPAQPGAAPGGAAAPAAPALAAAAGYAFPQDKLPNHLVPKTPVPDGLAFDEQALAGGDAARGARLYSTQSCIGCHYVSGNPSSLGRIGPNLTHVGSRTTLASGIYPNDARHLALWIKNARVMKPGVTMPTLGLNQVDPVTKMTVKAGGLTDQQIADIVAYLLALK